ncbi:MAG: HDOD domain-containing protein [Rehaibacterium terrae]|uniref:sensor domain-containing diguanylate cyclase n=1 Tax=Rehaibacterium terrae TaxID=1341696 RepID=UPI00391A19BC
MTPDLEARLAFCNNLPTLPGAALQLVELAQDPEAHIASAAKIISYDPALSAKVLRVANSPLYATQRKVENLRQALTVLGLNATLSLALGLSLAKSLRAAWNQFGHSDAVWRRSILAATACRCLGEKLALPRTEELMLAGLLQDIGRLVLGQLDPARYAGVCAEAADGDALLTREREAFGADHAEVGAWLARRWSLPAYLEQAIAGSENGGGKDPFDACVALSGLIADLWIVPNPEEHRRRVSDLAQAWLGLSRADFAEVITLVTESIPDFAMLFDMRLAEPERMDAIVEHARELLLIRNLKDIQEAQRLRREAERLEDHARALEDRARRDPLTGLFNRAHFQELLEKEFDGARQFGWPISLAFIDLDDFKQINDRFGHLVGDEVLRQFATVLAMSVRASDVLCRFGGEEFLLLLPGTGEAAARTLLQRLLQQISSTPMAEVDDQVIRVTASVGLATMSGALGYDSADKLVRAADRALYDAKGRGRNRICVAEGDSPVEPR